MPEMEFPAPEAGIVLTHFVVSSDVAASTDFYTRILGGKAVIEGCYMRDPDGHLMEVGQAAIER